MKRFSLVFLFVICASLSFAVATGMAEEKKHPIDIAIEKMLAADSSPAGQTLAYANCYQMWTDELNKNYQKLIQELVKTFGKDDTTVRAVKEAQKEWVDFRDKEFEALKVVHQKIFVKNANNIVNREIYIPLQAYDRAKLVKARSIAVVNLLITVQE